MSGSETTRLERAVQLAKAKLRLMLLEHGITPAEFPFEIQISEIGERIGQLGALDFSDCDEGDIPEATISISSRLFELMEREGVDAGDPDIVDQVICDTLMHEVLHLIVSWANDRQNATFERLCEITLEEAEGGEDHRQEDELLVEQLCLQWQQQPSKDLIEVLQLAAKDRQTEMSENGLLEWE